MALHEKATNRQPDRQGDGTDTLRERYQELLTEFRIILPGVQVLFGFLITAPFSSRFSDLDRLSEGAYATALVATVTALVVLLTPVAYHHLSDRHDREERIQVAIKFKAIGFAFLGVALIAAILGVVSFVFDDTMGILAASLLAGGALGLWLIFPIFHRQKLSSSAFRHRDGGTLRMTRRPEERNMSTESPVPMGAETLLDVLDRARESGYGTPMNARSDGDIDCGGCANTINPAAVDVRHVNRLEGASDSADEMLVALIGCPACDARGPLILNYGPNATDADAAVLPHLPIQPHHGPLLSD